MGANKAPSISTTRDFARDLLTNNEESILLDAVLKRKSLPESCRRRMSYGSLITAFGPNQL
jgi:hypothetical protein